MSCSACKALTAMLWRISASNAIANMKSLRMRRKSPIWLGNKWVCWMRLRISIARWIMLSIVWRASICRRSNCCRITYKNLWMKRSKGKLACSMLWSWSNSNSNKQWCSGSSNCCSNSNNNSSRVSSNSNWYLISGSLSYLTGRMLLPAVTTTTTIVVISAI